MRSAAEIRTRIEATFGDRIPAALTPGPPIIRSVASTRLPAVDAILEGGLPLGAITEIVGPECSGRTSFALSFIARMTQAGKICAWVDASNALHPESVAASGVDMFRLLWVRCGTSSAPNTAQSLQSDFALSERHIHSTPITKNLNQERFSPDRQSEVQPPADAPDNLLQSTMATHRRTESLIESHPRQFPQNSRKYLCAGKPWSRIEQSLRVIDLLLQCGGFSSIVLDMASIAPEHVSRVPLATWFRYRAAAERTQASILLLTQHASAKSSAGLVLRLQPGQVLREDATVFTGIEHHIEIARQRFREVSTNIIPIQKPSQKEGIASWHSRTTWCNRR